MLITKEHQEQLITNYVKLGKNQDECIGFIDGIETMNKLITDRSKLEMSAPELLEALKTCYRSLCSYGSHPIIEKQVENILMKLEK